MTFDRLSTLKAGRIVLATIAVAGIGLAYENVTGDSVDVPLATTYLTLGGVAAFAYASSARQVLLLKAENDPRISRALSEGQRSAAKNAQNVEQGSVAYKAIAGFTNGMLQSISTTMGGLASILAGSDKFGKMSVNEKFRAEVAGSPISRGASLVGKTTGYAAQIAIVLPYIS
ncbi:hypothetical protein HOC01_03370 [archaeon]|jgi:hypothetical protein|nr:hypothetical protein [archaeon]MBT6698549.1 hypothetical protein [archaeon]